MRTVVVIGGGPAGMLAAGTAAEHGAKVILLEKNEKLGKKLYITGKGRCNLTNNTDIQGLLAHTVSNPRFLQSAFHALDAHGLMAFFEKLGTPLKTERGGRVFPVSDRADDITKALVAYMRRHGVDVRLNCSVQNITSGFNVQTSIGTIAADAVIIATGGLSYPSTGSTGDGFKFAKSFDHTVAPTFPSLVPIAVSEAWVADLEGLSLRNVKCVIREAPQPCHSEKGFSPTKQSKSATDSSPCHSGLDPESSCNGLQAKPTTINTDETCSTASSVKIAGQARNDKRHPILYEETGEMLFARNSITGPIILRASAFLTQKLNTPLRLEIDLKPALTPEQLDARILRDFAEAQNKNFANALDNLLPQRLISVIIALSQIPPDKKVNAITKQERQALVALLKALPLTPTKTTGYNEAVITKGGVTVKEINPSTMQSKKHPGLFFAGEVLDVDALTGGYNLQIAFSTGYLAGYCAAQN